MVNMQHKRKAHVDSVWRTLDVRQSTPGLSVERIVDMWPVIPAVVAPAPHPPPSAAPRAPDGGRRRNPRAARPAPWGRAPKSVDPQAPKLSIITTSHTSREAVPPAERTAGPPGSARSAHSARSSARPGPADRTSAMSPGFPVVTPPLMPPSLRDPSPCQVAALGGRRRPPCQVIALGDGRRLLRPLTVPDPRLEGASPFGQKAIESRRKGLSTPAAVGGGRVHQLQPAVEQVDQRLSDHKKQSRPMNAQVRTGAHAGGGRIIVVVVASSLR